MKEVLQASLKKKSKIFKKHSQRNPRRTTWMNLWIEFWWKPQWESSEEFHNEYLKVWLKKALEEFLKESLKEFLKNLGNLGSNARNNYGIYLWRSFRKIREWYFWRTLWEKNNKEILWGIHPVTFGEFL